MANEAQRGDLQVTANLVIPAADLSWSASRSGGPGGQHVNTTSTKVDLRFDLAGTTALSEPVKRRLLALAVGRIDAMGRIVLTSSGSRSQASNLEEARARLANLIRTAVPPPKHRRPTKPSAGARRRRLTDKRQTAEKKAGRRRQDGDG